MFKKTKKRKSRYAKILFDGDSPFKQKVVRDKTKYVRKVKHPNKEDANE